MSTLIPLILGLVIFLGCHIVTRQRDLRARLIASKGEKFYRAVYSLVSLLGVALIAHGFKVYRAAGMIPVWDPPRWLAHPAMLLMWVSMILLVASNINAPGKIKARTKHPMLLATKIWATAHLLVNGDLGSIILFGAFLAWAVWARIMLKRAGDVGHPEAATAPNAARYDLIAIVAGTAITALFVVWAHKFLIGVAIIGV